MNFLGLNAEQQGYFEEINCCQDWIYEGGA
jgi:hypothetical protein